MKIYLSPIIPTTATDRIIYEFNDDIIKATLPNGQTDTFDFSTFGDGYAETKDIEHGLDVDVVLFAERVDGLLYVRLLNYVGFDSSETESNPEWIDASSYIKPVASGGEDQNEHN